MARPKTKAGYHHGDLRRALLDAALALVSEGNLGNLSLREVARRAGVTYAAPYHHFADKSALLAAVACQGFEVLVAELEAVARPNASLEAELLAMAEAYVAFALAHPSHYRVMYLPEVKDTPASDAVHAAADKAFGILLERVARAQPSVQRAQPALVATAVWAALHGLALLAIDGILTKKFGDSQLPISELCRPIVGMVVTPDS